jgi:hypothetical protein
MPCVVDDEEGIFLVVVTYEVCDRSIGLNLSQSREPTVDKNADDFVVIGVFKHLLEKSDLGRVNFVKLLSEKDGKPQQGSVTSGSTAISSHCGCHESNSTKTCL